MLNDTITSRYEASLIELGFSEAHALSLAALLPDVGEREAVALHVAHHLATLDENAELRPSAQWWAGIVAAALRSRYPHAAEPVAEVAGQGAVLLGMAWDPATLPPPSPVPALFAPDASAGRVQ